MARYRSDAGMPSAAVILVLIGGLFILLSGSFALLGMPTGVTFMEGHLMIQEIQGVSIYHGVIETLAGLLLVISVAYAYYRKGIDVQVWSVMVIVLSLLSLIGGGGFFIGLILSLMGGIFGIAYVYATTAGRSVYVGQAERLPVRHPHKIKTIASIEKGLRPEEKVLYKIVSGAGGTIFQAELVEKSGYSKVKVSRILDRLEGRGIIERMRRGMTNVVILRDSA